jgi:hypothetical protein
MDPSNITLLGPVFLREISERLGEAAQVAKAASACAAAGDVRRGVGICLDIEQLTYEASRLLKTVTFSWSGPARALRPPRASVSGSKRCATDGDAK